MKGEIVGKKEDFCFIRPFNLLPKAYPSDKDVFLSLKVVSKNTLDLAVGDLVEFLLGM